MVETKNCPNCEHLIYRLNPHYVCKACEKEYCRNCGTNEILCEECLLLLPRSVSNKVWIGNQLTPIVLFLLSLFSFSYAVFLLPAWMTLPWNGLFSWTYSGPSYIFLLLGLILSIFTFGGPRIGTKYLKYYITSVRSKDHFLEHKSNTHLKAVWIKIALWITFILNGCIIFLYLQRNTPDFGNYWLISAIIMPCALGLSLIVIIFAADFHRSRESSPRWRRILRNLWVYWILFSFFIILGGQIYYTVSIGGILPNTPEFFQLLINIWNIGYIVVFSSIEVLILDLITDKYHNQDHTFDSITDSTLSTLFSKFIQIVVKVIRGIWGFLLFILLIIIIAAGYMFLIGDTFMVISYFTTNIAIGIVFPVIMWLLLFVKKKSPKMIQRPPFRAFAKIGLVFGCLFLLPLLTIPLYTQPPIETQFEQTFGPDWQQKITSTEQQNMRQGQFSLFDNIFSYNTTANAKWNIPYMVDYPPRVRENTTNIEHTFYFDAYLPVSHQFGVKYIGNSIDNLLPIIIMMHGEVEDKGPWNANMTSEYLARQGYLVCDMNYGYVRTNMHGTNETGLNSTGYYLTDLIRQIGTFTQYLTANAEYFHADMNNVYFSGRHLGGGLALMCGFGYNNTFQEWFSASMQVRGIIPYYPVSDIGTNETLWAGTVPYFGEKPLPGSADPESTEYNPDWIRINPIRIAENINLVLAPVFLISPTHDWLITMKYNENFVNVMRNSGHTLIYAKYMHGNDGFDGNHYSPYGQSILYYYERFLILTH